MLKCICSYNSMENNLINSIWSIISNTFYSPYTEKRNVASDINWWICGVRGIWMQSVIKFLEVSIAHHFRTNDACLCVCLFLACVVLRDRGCLTHHLVLKYEIISMLKDAGHSTSLGFIWAKIKHHSNYQCYWCAVNKGMGVILCVYGWRQKQDF